jgi:nitrite reductase/ring-hydroxylating ferredoxin subunit
MSGEHDERLGPPAVARPWIRIANADDVVEGEPFACDFDGRKLGLYRVEGEVFALDDICPHQRNVRLSGGYFDGERIECPMHQSQFEVRTGRCMNPPAKADLRRYDVRIEAGGVLVNLE